MAGGRDSRLPGTGDGSIEEGNYDIVVCLRVAAHIEPSARRRAGEVCLAEARKDGRAEARRERLPVEPESRASKSVEDRQRHRGLRAFSKRIETVRTIEVRVMIVIDILAWRVTAVP